MLSEDSFPCLKKSVPALNNDVMIQKPMVMKYSDVLKHKKVNNLNEDLKFNEMAEKETSKIEKTDTLINNISEKTKKLSLNDNKSLVEHDIIKPNKNENNNNDEQNKEEDIQKKYQNNLDSIVKIQTWWRNASKIKSVENIKNSNSEEKSEKKENDKQNEENKNAKTISKKPSFSDIVKSSPPPSSNNEKPLNNIKNQNKRYKRNSYIRNKNNRTVNSNNNAYRTRENERKNQSKTKKVNEELNTIFKNMKFMGLIEKEIDALTKKNTIVNGKQFAKTKVVTVKKPSRKSSSSRLRIDDIVDNTKENKKKGNKKENKTNNKRSSSKKNVCFNEKDEVFNEYNHVMRKLDLQRRCDKKSCLIDCYRRLYKREWEEDGEISEESSSSSNSESEETNENTTSSINKKSDYLYNDIYNPNYTKYYSGSDYDFGNRYFTGKERLKKALHLEPVEVTVQKIIYQPIRFQKNKKYQQKKKNDDKRN